MRVIDLLHQLRIPFRQFGESPHVTEGWLGLQCPKCGRGSGNFGLGYNLSSGRISCWKCGGTSLAQTLAAICERPVREMADLVGGLDPIRVGVADRRGRLILPPGVGELGPAHRRYLESRDLDPDEMVETWKLGGIGISDTLQWRVFIPIHYRREVVSWTTRAIGDVAHTDRYRGAKRTEESVPRDELLYGVDRAAHAVVVFEGPGDVWAIGPGAVATFGTGFSPAQIRQIAAFSVRAVCFDREPEAQRRARRLVAQLTPFPGETNLVTLDAKDAGSATPAERREIRKRFLE